MSGRLETEEPTRRDFLGLAGLGAAATAILGSLVGMARLPKPRVLPEAGSRFSIGYPSEFNQGTTKVIPQRNAYVVAGADGIAVISLVCTHLGCIVAPTDTGFSCPCHGSRFSSDGHVIGGPAPRALRWLEVSRGANGKLVVNADREVPPGTFVRV